ncbi:MAG: exodeoxyribonuclease VII large subunit [Acidimicrobiales bacterium]|nr:MAG: exodeoxyribonuclease VII large subunit [Acidimicrobiales bacterium]
MDQALFTTEPPPPPRGEPSFSVAQLGELLAGALQQVFPEDLWVEGEISNLNRSRAGHVYFDLVEPAAPGTHSDARLSVVLFSQTKQVVNAQLKRQNVGRLLDGMAVRIRAAVDFYPPQGRLQLRMTGIDPRFILAAMSAERDALIARLHAEGITQANKQLTVPIVPLRVGLVTSAVSAAAGDFLTELNATGFGFQVTAVDARVQGELAASALQAGLLAMYREPVDVIALTRGGGSRGDLAVFDNEQLARTIADSPVPVFTGIGHEIDRSVADEVAHTTFKTPTAIAAGLGGIVSRYVEHTELTWAGVAARATAHTERARVHLASCARRGSLAGRDSINRAEHRLDLSAQQLPALADRIARTATITLEHVEARVHAADPSVLLARGWSITRGADGSVIKSVEQVNLGDTLVTAVADGTVISNASFTDRSSKDNDD